MHEVRAELWISVERLQELLKDSPKDERGNHIFQIIKRGNNFVLMLQNTEQVAIINEMISGAFRSIWDVESLYFQALTIPETLSPAPTDRKSSSKKEKYITMDINLYGMPRVRDIVGTALSSAQVFLQHPCYMDRGCEYDNPHFVSIPNVQPNLADASTAQERNNTPVKSSPGADPVENKFQSEIAVVFNSLMRARCLQKLDADLRIKTRLLE